MRLPVDSEFTFELLVCRWAETSWPPESPDRRGESPDPESVVVARQLGTRERRWDTVVVEADPEGLAARRALSDRGLDADLLFVVRNAPEEWAWYRDALPDPGYPWRYVRAAVHRAADRGVVETRRDGNRVQLRRVAPYPDWVRRVVAVENKPDLDASAARALAGQLDHDVSAGLADEVWVATAATGARVEPALLTEMPVEVGVLTVDAGRRPSVANDRRDGDSSIALDPRTRLDVDVAWHPARLEVDPDRVDKRLELAERAYGRGWRSYVDAMRPDCRSFELGHVGRAMVPYCAAKERHQSSAECSGACPSFAPEPPQWRTRGWPIEGGPGKAIQRLLDERRRRARSR